MDALPTLKNCQDHPAGCPSSEEPFLPTRALDLIFKDKEHALRRHVSCPGQTAQYAAMSYCWGGPQKLITTAQSIHSMTTGFELETVPSILRDAILVTRQLGIQYLWIDALCIVQDSPSDRAIELSKMGDIYRNATVTIASENAASIRERFLKKFDEDRGFRLPFRLPGNKFAKLTLLGDRSLFQDRAPHQLHAWILQETLLPSRLLTFGAKDVSWLQELLGSRNNPTARPSARLDTSAMVGDSS